ncbi:MAG: helicase-exonuclease AddAB subunit AddA [Clostridiales bacterium]|nr:helicase-exonuclease AddAB subunit AddA [Clostridiales bacterium]
MTRWTNEQRDAITLDGNLLVSAAAGSGKTAVLTERFVRLVTEGASIGEFLCVTFTTAAAAEMKKRVEKRLTAAALAAEDEALRERLFTAARDTVRANISTMHAFCTEVLRRHFHEAGLDPSFRVADEAEIRVLKQEVWDEVAEARFESDTGTFQLLLEALSPREEEAAEEILKLYDFILAQPDPFGWLRTAAERYLADEDALAASPAMAELVKNAKRILLAAADRLQGLRDAYAAESPKTAAQLDEEIMAVRGLALQEGYDAYGEALRLFPGFARISWKGLAETEKDRLSKAREGLKKLIREQQEMFARPLADAAAELKEQYPLMQELYCTVEALDKRYREVKSARSVIDYSDMEHMVLKLFRGDTAEEYRRRFRYIFIDEYQDSNPVQEEIIAAIARKEGLFLVGDVKQSIYRFRMAEPRLFMDRYARYKAERGGKKIDLNANFRSAQRVVDAVNGIFSRIMSAEAAEIEYDGAAALVHGRQDGGISGAAELILADMRALPAGAEADEEGETPFDTDEDERPDAVELEAALAAERIHKLMETEMIPDRETGEMRPLRFSDFAVLLRSHKGVAGIWTETLTASGVPAYAELSGGFFDAVEVRIFMDLLRVIDNRRRDISLAAVLRSPIGGFTTEEIAALRVEYGRDENGEMPACADSLMKAARYDTPLGKKAEKILSDISRWQDLSRLLSVEELCGHILDETGYLRFLTALPSGKQRAANMEAFTERARLYERSGVRSLSSFLSFMEKVVGTGTLGAAETAGADVVRVMSIHKSKGLEFPVVIVAGLAKKFNRRGESALLTADGALGIAAKYEMRGIRQESVYRKAIAARMRMKNLAEEMRVLYVAMTRARERLILLSALPKAEKAVREAGFSLSRASVANAGSFIDWILGAVMATEDGDILRKHYGIPWKPAAPSMGIDVSLRAAAGSALLDHRMTEGAYARFVRSAETGGEDYRCLFESAYAFAADTVIPSRVSVTGLAGKEISMAEAPLFAAKDARFTAADRGTAVHTLLCAIPLAVHSTASMKAEIDRLVHAGILSPEEGAAIRPYRIASFFASAVGRRLIAAKEVLREQEFNYRVSARRLLGADTDAEILLQGVIDCCFMEDDGWVLLDYKTDYVPEGTDPRLAAAKHTEQLFLYAEALQALTGKPVKEGYVCLLNIGENVRML